MQKNTHLVSIITPSYNSAKYVVQTIESVLAQTYQNWEMIIVDDCSTDDSIDVIQSFVKKDNRIKLYQLGKNSGAAVARNKAIELAQGSFIAFLDSDDLWTSDKLEKQIEFMQKNNLILSYTGYEIMDEFGNKTGEFVPPTKLSYKDLLKTCSIGCLTAIYNADILGKVYMPVVRKRQDYALWLKILRQGYMAYGMTEILARYRIHSSSISANKINAAQYQWKIYRECEKLNLIKSCYYFIQYAVHGVIKHKFKYSKD